MGTLTSGLNILLNILGCAFDLFIYGWGLTTRQLTEIDYRKQGRRIRTIGLVLFLLIVSLCLLTVLGLYIGYFYKPWVGWLMLVTAGILTLVIFLGFKVLEFTVGTAIFTVRLAKAIAINPAIWVTKETAKLVWNVSTWPIEFSFDSLKALLGGLLSIFGVKQSMVEQLLKDGWKEKEKGPKESAWAEADQRLKELMTAARRTSLFVTVVLKNAMAAITAASLVVVVIGGPHDPNGPFGFLNSPVFAFAASVLWLLLFSLVGLNEYLNRKGGVSDNKVTRKGFKVVAWTAGVVAFLVIFSHWQWGTLDFLFQRKQVLAAQTKRQTDQLRHYQKGFVRLAATYQVKRQGNALMVRCDSLGAPTRTIRAFKDQPVFFEGTDVVNGQVYAIVSLPDQHGVKVPGLYFAILYESLTPFSSPEEEQGFYRQREEEQKRQAAIQTGYFPQTILRGQELKMGRCEVEQQSNGKYFITVPTGPYITNATNIEVKLGQRLLFNNITCHGVRGGDPNDCDGANALVTDPQGWKQNPPWLAGRELACPQANFMAIVGHILEPKSGAIVSSFPLINGMTVPASGYLIFGPNEPFRGRDIQAAQTNQGQWELLVSVIT